MASITVRPVAGRNTRASRLCMPQSSPEQPLSGNGSERGGTLGANRSPAVRLSVSGTELSFSDPHRGAGRRLRPATGA
jgi:hypothetical protein